MISPVGPGDDRPVPGQGGLGPPPRLPPAACPCRPASPPHGRTSVRAPLPLAGGPEQGGLGPPPPPPAAVRLPPAPGRPACRPSPRRPHGRTSAPVPPAPHPASRPPPAGLTYQSRGLHRGRIAQAAGEPEPERGASWFPRPQATGTKRAKRVHPAFPSAMSPHLGTNTARNAKRTRLALLNKGRHSKKS